MDGAAALPRGLVTTSSLEEEADGPKKIAVKCLWCPVTEEACGP